MHISVVHYGITHRALVNANSFSSDGSYQTVEVTSGNVTQIRLVNSEDAAF